MFKIRALQLSFQIRPSAALSQSKRSLQSDPVSSSHFLNVQILSTLASHDRPCEKVFKALLVKMNLQNNCTVWISGGYAWSTWFISVSGQNSVGEFDFPPDPAITVFESDRVSNVRETFLQVQHRPNPLQIDIWIYTGWLDTEVSASIKWQRVVQNLLNTAKSAEVGPLYDRTNEIIWIHPPPIPIYFKYKKLVDRNKFLLQRLLSLQRHLRWPPISVFTLATITRVNHDSIGE